MAETAIIDANNPANGMKVNSDGSINANTTVTPPANQRVSSLANDFATGSIVDLLTLLTTIQAIISGGKLLNTETNSASIKTDLDTLLTDMTELLGDTDNLATLAGIVSGGKGAVKAGAGDFADLATIAGAISAGKMAVSGTITETNSASILADLATLAGAIISSVEQTNIAKVGGQIPTLDNTTIQAVSMRGKGAGTAGDTALLLDMLGQMTVEQFIQYQIMQGHGFRVTTGLISTGATNAYVGMQAIANNVNKHFLFYNILGFSGLNTSSNDIRLYTNNANTADTALTASLTAKNQQPASATTSVLSTLAGSPASTTQVGSFVGTEVVQAGATGNTLCNLLQNPSLVYFAPNDVGSLAAYVKVGTSGNPAGVTIEWIEW